MTGNNNSKAPAKRGFKKLSFDEAFPEAEKAFGIREELASRSLSADDRDRLQAELRAIENRLTPAFRQSSAPFASMVRKEAKAWMEKHGGMPNISEFISNFQAQPDARRHRKFGSVAATDSTIRKILRGMGIRGKPGRPKES